MAPMSFIMEVAGGRSITGNCRALDLKPDTIHQRVPIFMGSLKGIEIVEKFF